MTPELGLGEISALPFAMEIFRRNEVVESSP